MLKLYHCTDNWNSRDIKGKKLLSTTADGSKKLPYFVMGRRAVGTQAVLSHTSHHAVGCCRSDGCRVIEVDERHFLQQWKGKWELYFLQAVPVKADTCDQYKLVSGSQCSDKKPSSADRDDVNTAEDGTQPSEADNNTSSSAPGFVYSYLLQPQHLLVGNKPTQRTSPGTCDSSGTTPPGSSSPASSSAANSTTLLEPSMIRMELSHYFRPILLNNPSNHVHVVIVMDRVVVDRYLWKQQKRKRQEQLLSSPPPPPVMTVRPPPSSSSAAAMRYTIKPVQRLKQKLTQWEGHQQQQQDDEQVSVCSYIDDCTTVSTSTTTSITSSLSKFGL